MYELRTFLSGIHMSRSCLRLHLVLLHFEPVVLTVIVKMTCAVVTHAVLCHTHLVQCVSVCVTMAFCTSDRSEACVKLHQIFADFSFREYRLSKIRSFYA